MIYELRTYTVRQGTLPDVVKAASTVSRDIRKDDYGKLEGYWNTDIGPLNQVMHLWSYADLNERARLRAELAKNPRWNGEYIPLIRPHLMRQDIRLLNARGRPRRAGAHAQRLRVPQLSHQAGCRAPVGRSHGARCYRRARSIPRSWGCGSRKRRSPTRLCHIWAYNDLNQRAQVRADARRIPDGQRSSRRPHRCSRKCTRPS